MTVLGVHYCCYTKGRPRNSRCLSDIGRGGGVSGMCIPGPEPLPSSWAGQQWKEAVLPMLLLASAEEQQGKRAAAAAASYMQPLVDLHVFVCNVSFAPVLSQRGISQRDGLCLAQICVAAPRSALPSKGLAGLWEAYWDQQLSRARIGLVMTPTAAKEIRACFPHCWTACEAQSMPFANLWWKSKAALLSVGAHDSFAVFRMWHAKFPLLSEYDSDRFSECEPLTSWWGVKDELSSICAANGRLCLAKPFNVYFLFLLSLTYWVA